MAKSVSKSTTYRGVGALSGILGLSILVVSAFLLNQALDYRDSLGNIFGYQLPNLGQNTNYQSNNQQYYNVLGYDVDPPIGVAAGGIVVGILQFLLCFLLCSSRRFLSIGWAVVQFLLFIGAIVCFVLGIYFEVYSRKILPSYNGNIPYGQGYRGGVNIRQNIYDSPGFRYNQQNPNFNPQNGNPYYNNNRGGIGVGGQVGNDYDSEYVCNPAGQAFCALMGINILFIFASLIIVGCAHRRSRGDPNENPGNGYAKDDTVKSKQGP